MSEHPEITLKLAISINGYIDDDSNDRLILSSIEDLEAVDVLRAKSDAILVGANTIRCDDPSLRVKNNKLIEQRLADGKKAQPIRICLSSSNDLPVQAKFFDNVSEEKIIIAKTAISVGSVANTQLLAMNAGDPLSVVLSQLKKQGVKNLLVEGGSATFNTFFTANLFDKIRIAIAPVFVSNGTRLNVDINSMNKMTLTKREQFADTTVLWLEK